MNAFLTAFTVVSLGIGLLSTASCVSSKKYKDAQSSLSTLRKQNAELREDLGDSKRRLELMEEANESAAGQLDAKDKILTENEQRLAAQQQKLQELQELIGRQRQKTEALRKRMSAALGNFSSDELSVFTKNGKVYVSVSEKLLFPSGSAQVNTEGKEALAQVARALQENAEINVNVEGHTDTVPIKIRFPDNWALSVARSTAIVRILTNDYGVAPTRFTASGRSQYEPVAANETAEGRAKNRRTEIILAPRLDELMELIEGVDVPASEADRTQAEEIPE